MIDNRQPVRIALKTLHDRLIEQGGEIELLQADLALLMAVADHLNVAIDYSGLSQAIDDNDYECLDALRTELVKGIAKARGGQTGEFDSPW